MPIPPFIYLFMVLGIEPRALCALGKCCTPWSMPSAVPQFMNHAVKFTNLTGPSMGLIMLLFGLL
jgi:hypothetical protein